MYRFVKRGVFPTLDKQRHAELDRIKRDTGLTFGVNPATDKHYRDALKIADGTIQGNLVAADRVIKAALRHRPLELSIAARRLYDAEG